MQPTVTRTSTDQPEIQIDRPCESVFIAGVMVCLPCAPCVRSGRSRSRNPARLFPRLDGEMPTPILLIAGFCAFFAEGPFLAVGHDRQPVGADSKFHEIIPNGLRTFFPEHQIV